MDFKNDNKTIKNILLVFLFVLIFYLLSILSNILIPLILALLFALLFQPLIMFLRKIKIPKVFIMPFVLAVSLCIIYGIYELIVGTVLDIVDQKEYLLSKLNEKLTMILHFVNSFSGTRFRTSTFPEQLYGMVDKKWLSNVASDAAAWITSFSTSFFMFVLYYIVLLTGIPEYKKYIKYVGGVNGDSALEEYELIQKSIVSYMMIKTLINLGTGIAVFVICTLFGIKFAIFWGFLAFLLHFVPSIGSIAGTIPPLLMAIIQYDTWGSIAILAVSLICFQMLIGYFIEPMIMGDQLHLNTLTVLFGLVFWGWLWGIPGMILSVPMLVILKLILEKYPDTAAIGRLMGSPKS